MFIAVLRFQTAGITYVHYTSSHFCWQQMLRCEALVKNKGVFLAIQRYIHHKFDVSISISRCLKFLAPERRPMHCLGLFVPVMKMLHKSYRKSCSAGRGGWSSSSVRNDESPRGYGAYIWSPDPTPVELKMAHKGLCRGDSGAGDLLQPAAEYQSL